MGEWALRIGTSLQVIVGNIGSFRSKVIDQHEDVLFIDYPQEWEARVLANRSECTIYYMADQKPQIFQADIQKAVQLRVPALQLTHPNAGEIASVQRREYVRVEVNADIAIHFINSEQKSVITVTQDISGGGARIILPQDTDVAPGETIELYLVLKAEGTEYEYVYSEGQVIDTHLQNGVHSISVKFLLASEAERQKIIRYCFAVERSRRRQGIK